MRFWGWSELVPYAWGAGFGLLTGWIWWRLPDHLRTVQNKIQIWRERLPWNAREIARIEGAFIPDAYTPILAPPPPLRDRILEYWRQWKEETRPRTPEEVALSAYRREIAGLYGR